MSFEIYLRPLREEDAAISYKWRNDPEVWKYTGSKPDKEITYEIEKSWIEKKLKNANEIRYAICLLSSDEYIGNVQLTDIHSDSAEFHIFIGNKKYWGKGIGKSATRKMIEIGFNEMNLKTIYLEVNENNVAAIRAYEKIGFKIKNRSNSKIYMSIQNNE